MIHSNSSITISRKLKCFSPNWMASVERFNFEIHFKLQNLLEKHNWEIFSATSEVSVCRKFRTTNIKLTAPKIGIFQIKPICLLFYVFQVIAIERCIIHETSHPIVVSIILYVFRVYGVWVDWLLLFPSSTKNSHQNHCVSLCVIFIFL